MNELINLVLMLTAMLVGALFMAFEAITGIRFFAVEPNA